MIRRRRRIRGGEKIVKVGLMGEMNNEGLLMEESEKK